MSIFRIKKHRTLSSEKGNILILIGVVLVLLFSIGGFSIDTAIYLLRREQLQGLAETVALEAALSFPQRATALNAANAWYDKLRIENGKMIAPVRDVSTFTVSFNETAGTNDTSYKLNSVTITISDPYTPRVFPITGFSGTISVVGTATAQLKPTDIELIVESSASFYDAGTASSTALNTAYGTPLDNIYASQCFSPAYTNFKKGVIELYDQLSQIGTFRVGVIYESSHIGSYFPFALADLGQTEITLGDLEYSADEPNNAYTRCSAMTTSSEGHTVPLNPNYLGSVWAPRTDLSGTMFCNGVCPVSTTPILTREALWIKQAGYSVGDKGYIPMISYFANPTYAINIAISSLTDSRRTDGLDVGQRIVLWLTDDSGMVPPAVGGSASNGKICELFSGDPMFASIKMGVLYFGHNQELYGHDYHQANANGLGVQELRDYCTIAGNAKSGMFFAEVSPDSVRWPNQTDFRDKLAPTIAHALKEAELVR